MKRVLSFLLLLLLPLGALATESTEPLTGVVRFPEGATETDARYVLRYSCPRFAGDAPEIEAVNDYYAAFFADMAETGIPQLVESLDALPAEGEPAYYTEIDYTVERNTDEHLSVLLSCRQFLGNSETESVIGNVFALQGVYAGQPLTLSQATGLEQTEGGESYASRLVYTLIWQIVTEQSELRQREFFEDVSKEAFEAAFTPETDFYLDTDGNLVFYIQPGVLASEVEGVLYYPFSTAELLSAVKE